MDEGGRVGIPGRRACQSEPLASERTSASEALRTGDDGRGRPTANAGPLRKALEPADQLEHGLAGHIQAALGHHAEVVAGAMPAAEVEIDQVDRGHSRLKERQWSSWTTPCDSSGNARTVPALRAADSQPRPQAQVREPLARNAQTPVAHEVEQHHRPRPRESAGPPPCCRAGPPPRTPRRPRREGSPRHRRGRSGSCASVA